MSSRTAATRVANTSAPERLRRRADLAAVYARGQRVSRRGVTVVALARESEQPTRAAHVAGRAVGGAVDRNRAKRRLREAVRVAVPPQGWDVIIVASPAVVTMPFTVIVDTLEEIWKKLA